MNSNSLVSAASFSARSIQPPDAWIGHMPFAAWVVRQVAPRIFVELGTHSGNSYFSFCQSIAEAGLATKAYAVDTWQGDEHAGYYDETVWARANAHNQDCYSGFSRLLRMTFDEAAPYFSDGSIDLLHIDGLHTYEAARHDFETWLPKLSHGAIVMFHDTNVRERGFAVWRLWEELRSRYPNHLDFVHSHGLGIFQLDNAAPANRQPWLQSEKVDQQELKTYFAALGSKQLDHFASIRSDELTKRVSELEGFQQQAANLTLALATRDTRIAELERHAEEIRLVVADRDALIAEVKQVASELSQELEARDRKIAGLSRESEELSRQIVEFQGLAEVASQSAAAARERIEQQSSEIAGLAEVSRQSAAAARARIEQQGSEIAGLGDRIRDLEASRRAALATISDIRASTSWRSTYPIRALKRFFTRVSS